MIGGLKWANQQNTAKKSTLKYFSKKGKKGFHRSRFHHQNLMFNFMNTMSSRRQTDPNVVVKDSIMVRPVESIAGSIVDEMRTLMFGRTFHSTPQNSDFQQTKSLKKVSVVKTDRYEVDSSKKTLCESSTISSIHPKTPSKSNPPSSNDDVSKLSDVPTTPESSETISRKKRKSKGKHRRKSEHHHRSSSNADSSESNSQSADSLEKKSRSKSSNIPSKDESTLPNHILIPTFQKVMSKGLVLNLITQHKKSIEMTFWIDQNSSILKWSKQKTNTEKKGGNSCDLKCLESVIDAGTLEISLEFTTGLSIEFSCSSSVEKSLLLRSFLLAMETGIYQ